MKAEDFEFFNLFLEVSTDRIVPVERNIYNLKTYRNKLEEKLKKIMC